METKRRAMGSTGIAALLVSVLFAAAPAGAQLPNPSAAALGMGDNHTALARGYSAISTNPAGLAAPDAPGSSFALFSVRGLGGIGPVGLDEIGNFEGDLVPDAARREWRDWIVREGSERGAAGAELTFLAAHAGHFGVQLSTTANLAGAIGPGAAELILFGNAGLTGEPADYLFEGDGLDVVVASTLAFAYGRQVMGAGARTISVGATLKYTMGHLMVTAENSGSELSSDPLAVRVEFPVAQSDTLPSLDRLDQGTGVGLDLGALFTEGPLVLGVSIRNVFNTFAWDEASMYYRPGQAILTPDESITDFEARDFADAPGRLVERVRDLGYAPTVDAGAALEVDPSLLLVANIRGRFGDAQPFEPAHHVGAGAEYRPLRWLPLRAGAAWESDGFLLSAGAGVSIGVLRFDAGLAARRTDLGTASVAMFTFSSESRN
jgi:hypothetical protein